MQSATRFSRHLPNHLLASIAIFSSLVHSSAVVQGQTKGTIEADSKITSVTVYRAQANVVREIELQASEVPQSIRIGSLPSALLDQSLRWESDGEVNVRSIRMIEKSEQLSREERDKRQKELLEKQQSAQEAAQRVAVIEQDLETIDQLVQFSADKTKTDLESSRLNVESVSHLADFVMQRRRSLAQELLKARREMETIQSEAERLMRRRGSAGQGDRLTGYEALLSVEAPLGGSLRLSYWVDHVRWNPAYTIHAETGEPEDRFTVRLNGTLAQNSGEDWKAVTLFFCTGSPELQAAGPALAPLRVSVDGAIGQADAPAPGLAQFAMTGMFGSEGDDWEDAEARQRDLNLNTSAAARQIFEFNERQGVQRELASDAGDNIADETYQVAGKIDVPHGTRDQNIMILRMQAGGQIYRTVTPLLSSFAYREARLPNDSGQNLVGAEATVLLDGRFVGTTALAPTAAGGEFTLGLGADRQIRTRRELLSRHESVKGGNRLSELKYRLVVSNFHDRPTEIRLYDRIPISDDEGLVNVITSDETLGGLSRDARYLRMQRPTGILRWDLSIPAKRFGSKAFDHHYRYTVETERARSIVGKDLEQQLSRDLQFERSGGGGMGGGMGGSMGGGGSF